MTLTEIKNSFFGYNKNEVCRYVSELNELHAAESKATEEEYTQKNEELLKKNNSLTTENSDLKEAVNSLKEEIENLKSELETQKAENVQIQTAYQNLEDEVSDLRSKSDVISTAIINAEKCASNMIVDATNRANTMVSEAEEKVNAESKRLATAKDYIAEIRTSLTLTMKNIDNVLSDAEGNISTKLSDIAENKSVAVKDKYGIFEKDFFKRA